MRVIIHIAKIFKNGQSQAVRLPKEFKFTTSKVNITPLGNSIVIQPLLKTWSDVFREIKSTNDFFAEERKDLPPQERRWEMFK